MSVTIAADAGAPDVVLAGRDFCGLAELVAGHARSCSQTLRRDPRPENPAHAYVVGAKNRANKACLIGGMSLIIQPRA
jgi:hypothetical protein